MHCISYKRNFSEKGEICVSNSNSMMLRIFDVCVCVLNSLFRSENKRMRMYRGQKNNANFFLYKVFRQPFGSWTSENRGRLHQKMRFPAAPVVERNFLTPGHPGVRVRNVHGKSGPKSLCLCCFSSLNVSFPARIVCFVKLLRTKELKLGAAPV